MNRLTPRLAFALSAIANGGLVAGGLVLAKTLNLAACPLCILQRMMYLTLCAIAIAALLLPRCRNSQIAAAGTSAIAAATGAFIASYQVWLQRFATDVSCTANAPWWEEFVYWAGEKVPFIFEATGLCSEAGWKFLGLAIADWSLLAFSTTLILALRTLLQLLRTRS